MGVSRKLGRKLFGVVSTTAVILAITVPLTTTVASAAPDDNFSQCGNGPLATPNTCTGNYQNGNLNPNNAHFREGDFVPYRVGLNSLAAGTHTFAFHYRPGDSGEHAIDYIGSYDATETTSTSASQFYKNNHNPCSDLAIIPSAWCIPTSLPAAQKITVPPADFAGANLANCSVNGTFKGTQQAGTIDIFGPPGTAFTGIAYTEQNVSNSGGCDSAIIVQFTLPVGLTSGQDVLITWGGHIASVPDWGQGNAAGNIPGSPYHMILDTLDAAFPSGTGGTGLGSTDRSMKTTTIFFTPTISTQIEDASGPVSAVNGGDSIFDTATLSGASSTAGGTLTYARYSTANCTGSTPVNQIVNVTNGVVPNSSPFVTPIGGGAVSYLDTYSGDPGTNTEPVTAGCENLTVNAVQPTLVTHVQDATNTNIVNPIAVGTVVHDTSVLSGGHAPQTGTVTYNFYTNGSCTLPFSTTQTVAVSGGQPLPSSASSPLMTGSYSYLATYSGDSNNLPATATCEVITVSQGTSAVATTLHNAANNAALPGGTPSVPLGTSIYDTNVITPSPTTGFTLGGTVTYDFFHNGTCNSTPATTQTVAPNTQSTATGPLAAGSYSFQATWTGDANYTGNTSPCEPFTVAQGSSTVATVLHNGATNAVIADNAHVPLGTTVYDTSSENPNTPGFTPLGGTVSYTFFSDTSCTTAIGSKGTGLALTAPSTTVGPLAAGTYGFEATWTGDANFTGNTSPCEPFTVNQGTSTVATVLHNAANNAVITEGSTVPLGASVYDTSSENPSTPGFTPLGGTVSYTFFSDSSCTTAIGTKGTSLALTAPSTTVGPLAAGHYGFEATWTGDANFTGNTSPCEPFTVGQGTSTVATVLHNAANNAVITEGSTVPLGASVYDTSSENPSSPGFTPLGGTVSYTFFSDSSCTTAIGTKGTGLALTAPSTTVGPLAAGHYGFEATWTGDSNFTGNTSPCEPFTVGQGTSTVATVLHNAANNAAISDGTHVPLGTSVYDTSSENPSSPGFTPLGGTVSYTFFSDTSCTTAIGPEGTGLALTAPSTTVGPLAAGSYGFEATWTGDSNFAGNTSPCEPFTVNKGTSTVATVLKNASGNTTITDGSTVPLGTSVYDTSSENPNTPGFTPLGGTVSYTFFSDSSCTTAIGPEGTGLALTAPSSTVGPLAAGSYGFEATWTGDSNFTGNTSPCEPFTVSQGFSGVATTLHNANGGATITDGSHVPLGTEVYDTNVVTPNTQGFTLGGTVTYTFFGNTDCSTPPASTPEGTGLALTAHSSTVGPLAAGGYGFEATWTGDANFTGNTSPCEPFTVDQGTSAVATTLKNAADNSTITDGSQVPLNTSVYDTNVVTPNTQGFTLGGTVSYTFFSDSVCDTSVGTEGTGLPLNTQSNTVGPLAAGNYGFEATWTGDANFTGNTSPCEPFTVTTPNFTILKTDVPGNNLPVAPGSTIPYTITVQNLGNGPGTATIADPLPSSITMTGAPSCAVTNSATDTCTVPTTAVTTLDATITLASGDTATITFSAVVDKVDTADVVNTATIKTGVCNPTTTTNAAVKSHAVTIQCSSTVTNPVPDFTVTKTDTPGNGQSVTAGTTIPYTVAIKNVGDGAGSATITDTLPSNLTIQGTPKCAVTGSDTCTVTNTTGSTWTFAVALAVGDTATVTFSATVGATATGSVTNTATITTGPCNTSSGCASTVSNPIPPVTTPATTPPPPPPPPVIAFTGADIAAMAAGGLVLIGLGGFLLLLSRRRRQVGENA